MAYFRIYQKEDLLPLVSLREGEDKLGSFIRLISDKNNWSTALRDSDATFVILGIPEDTGIRANNGTGGAHTAWDAFLKSFLNVQHSEKMNGNTILLLGAFDFSDWAQQSQLDITQLRNLTSRIDNIVFPFIREIIAAGKILVVIGGGHNNCYPLIKGCSMALDQKINAINLDAHADFRVQEGRHSGNGFRYAFDEGYLDKYTMLGLHENYNNQTIISEIKNNDRLSAIWWEDIFLRKALHWKDAVARSIRQVAHQKFGVELDVDAIENVLSSAETPVGINAGQAMEYLYECGHDKNACYLHLPEGAAMRNDGKADYTTGKLLSYLVTAFIKGKMDSTC